MTERIVARIFNFLSRRVTQSFKPGERIKLVKAILETEPVDREEAVVIVQAVQASTKDFYLISCDSASLLDWQEYIINKTTSTDYLN